MMVYGFTEMTNGYRTSMFGAYLESITGINDDFWEEHVLGSTLYAIETNGAVIGIFGIHNREKLTLFYIDPPSHRHAQPAFTAVIQRFNPLYAYVATNDEPFLSLCMDYHRDIEMQAYFFRKGGHAVRPPAFQGELLRRATLEDAPDILDEEGVEENIRLGKYYVMRKDGVFLGQGFINRSTASPHTASIGMSVHPAHRQRGVGRSIIMHMSEICLQQGLTPVCGCWYYNHNSKRTLESAGFITNTRLLKVWFVEKGTED